MKTVANRFCSFFNTLGCIIVIIMVLWSKFTRFDLWLTKWKVGPFKLICLCQTITKNYIGNPSSVLKIEQCIYGIHYCTKTYPDLPECDYDWPSSRSKFDLILTNTFCNIDNLAIIFVICNLCNKSFQLVSVHDIDLQLWPSSRSNFENIDD